MNDKQNKSNLGKTWFIFYPLVLYFAVKSIIVILFESVIIYKIMQQYPAMEMMDIYKKVMEYVASANSELMIVTSALTIVAGAVIFFRNDYKVFDKKYQNKIGLKGFLGSVSLSAGFYMLIDIIFIVALSVFDISDIMEAYDTNISALFSDNLLVDIFALGIITPISEELIFRGLTFNRMRSVMKESSAIVFSAVVFGFMHMDNIQIFYALILGLILAYSYSKYENILVPIIIHMSFNLMNFVFLLGFDIPTTKGSSLIFYGLCILFTYIGIKILIKKSKPSLRL